MPELRSPGQVRASWEFRFIRATADAVPDVWADLKGSAEELYAVALRTLTPRPQVYADALRGRAGLTLSGCLTPHAASCFHELLAVIRKWQVRWNLNAPFCERYALATLNFWHEHRQELDVAEPVDSSLGSAYVDPRPYVDPRTQDPRRRRHTSELRRQAVWRPATDLNPNALRWLALYQCGGLTAQAISDAHADREEDDYANVKKSLERAARALGLPLRVGRRGFAPRGLREST